MHFSSISKFKGLTLKIYHELAISNIILIPNLWILFESNLQGI